MSLESLGSIDNAKLRNVVNNGVATYQKIKDLREAQRDLVKALAEEYNLDVKDLNKAIKILVKDNLEAEKESMTSVETIIQLVGAA